MATSLSGGLRWLGVELLTGTVLCDLPGISISQTLNVTIAQKETCQVSLFLDDNTDAAWLQATQPGGGALIAYLDHGNDAPILVWGGIVTQRQRGIVNEVVLGLETPETYLDACQMPAYTATNRNQDSIIADWMSNCDGTNQPSWVLNHVNPSTQTQTISYAAASNTSVYKAMQALSALNNGPEWTVGWTWNGAGTILPTLTYGSRIGNPKSGTQPAVTLEIADFEDAAFLEDYTSGKGANRVMAIGSVATPSVIAMAVGPPYSGPTKLSKTINSETVTASNLLGRPLWTYAWKPNAQITDATTLTAYATKALAQTQNGAQSAQAVLPLSAPGKQFGQDWNIGDDIGYYLYDGMAWPTAIQGTARVVGYQLDQATVTPILTGVVFA